jgi:DNA (cytosine-5)-methyltransferase 1
MTSRISKNGTGPIRYVDLFCGIGGFRVAMERVCGERGVESACVFSCDIDPDARRAYETNFGERPHGDITKIDAHALPDFDLLFAGFPCQPFSICGDRKGFGDARGALFFDIARLLEAQKPAAFLLENVKLLAGHDRGRTLRLIMETLKDLGYHADYRILNALSFGLPQKRERVFIVGSRRPMEFPWPEGNVPMRPLSDLLERETPPSYLASERIRRNRREKFEGEPPESPSIWHENKGGHVSAYPYSCALRSGASHNYLLVDGKRRLTEREMLRLQGFPDRFKIVGSYAVVRKQAGNSVAVPCIEALLRSLLDSSAHLF